ncbi:MAG: penicillin-binding protein 2 [Anaerolineae bacterium]|nr:penicillin-binding protein 2 [Anaerolineae bacterium]
MSIRDSGIERQITHLGRTMALGFLAITLGLGYWVLVRGPALVRREDNPRLIESERRIERGDILDRRGLALAHSVSGAGGVWERVYPEPSAAPVVGYASIDLGTGGIEATYDAQLRGERPGAPLAQLRDQLLHVYPVGADVRLAIDRELQREAAEALGIRTGAVVVLDARSGEILALVSRPTFDPNTLEEDWPQLQFNPDKPMLNRATQGLYPPGLVFETLTLAAVLEDGLATPTTPYTDELGVVIDVEPPISCPTDPPQVHFTLAEAYTWPCSVLFARLGLEMGGERLADHVTRLGIGRPLDLPLEVATGQVLERGIWTRLLAARTAMGQGEVLVTPLEMALAAAAIANDGVQPAPRLVLEVDGEPVAPSAAPRRVLRPETARDVQAILVQSFAVGRTRVALPAADVAGRGGPAESGLPGAPPHAWFIGMAPAIEPRYAIAVVVEYGYDGWETAAPIAIEVLQAAAALP